jgi:hypothetical protein
MRRGESIASARATNSRLSAARPARFPSRVGGSVSRQRLRLERLQARDQSRAALPNLTRADEPESRILREAFGVVNVFVTSQAAIDRLPSRSASGNWIFLPRRESFKCRSTSSLKPRRSSSSRTRIRPPSEACPEGFSKGHSCALDFDSQGTVEREPKEPLLPLTHRRFPPHHPDRIQTQFCQAFSRVLPDWCFTEKMEIRVK